MSNQRRLGRGLEALLGRSLDESPSSLSADKPAEKPSESATSLPKVENAESTNGSSVSHTVGAPLSPSVAGEVLSIDDQGQRWLDLGVIQPNPFQPRKQFDEVEIADLADSFREHGVLQPLVVRQIEGRFELVAGERRLRAAQAAGWERVPVQLRELSDQQTAEMAIVENVQRKDLNAIEKAASFKRYLDQYDCTHDELAKRIQVDRSTIANLVRLLELPESVKQMVVDGKIAQGHARAMLSLPSAQIEILAKQVCSEGLSVRKTEGLVQDKLLDQTTESLRIIGSDGVSRKPTTPRSAQLASLQKELQKALGTKVELKQSAKGKGKITVHFKDHAEFDRLRAVLSQPAAARSNLATGTE